MRFAVLLFLFSMASSLYASEVCRFNTTEEIEDAVAIRQVKKIKISKNHRRFSEIEKELIWRAVSSDQAYRRIGREEALSLFADMAEGRRTPGANAGEIIYYQLGSKDIILVHYWPGDNEYGAYFELLPNNKFKMVATVSDSDIACK